MQLYLVQHGQAKSKDVDPERHLTDDGRRDVEKTAAFLKPLAIDVQAIRHSGKMRAAQTAEILASAVACGHGIVQYDGLSPNDNAAPIVEEIARLNHDIFIVGHLPFLSKLASTLLCGKSETDIVHFQNGCVVCLEQNEENTWTINWMVTPALL